ncbi:immunoglobulin kappa light chain-like [Protopterus annectens]|uniref:immunoglobulin kappa light chain-like n=1 Tax=Protopterus annectens TaxID=7888 RepID=UPI001CF9A5C0|nr:immunoglobulin kappa light chain-like [Protopterus annectens]
MDEVLHTTFLLFCFGRIQGMPFLRQNAPSVTTEGTNPTIKCLVENGKVDGFVLSWYQQLSKQGPTFLLSQRANKKPIYGAGISERFLPTIEENTNSFTLTIGNVDKQDSGIYYCAIWYANQYIFGAGADVIILGKRHNMVHQFTDKGHTKRIKKPSVQLLGPSCVEIAQKSSVTFICLASDFYPKHIRINWHINHVQTSSGTQFPFTENEDGTFNVPGVLTLPANTWAGMVVVTCEVEHEALAIPLNKSIKHEAKQKKGQLAEILRGAFFYYLAIISVSIIYGFGVSFALYKKKIEIKRLDAISDNLKQPTYNEDTE